MLLLLTRNRKIANLVIDGQIWTPLANPRIGGKATVLGETEQPGSSHQMKTARKLLQFPSPSHLLSTRIRSNIAPANSARTRSTNTNPARWNTGKLKGVAQAATR